MNWLLFPVYVEAPSRNPASPFQPFSNDGVSPWNPTVALKSVRVQGRDAGIEAERAARALAQFRLPVIHQVMQVLETKADFVLSLHPACVAR